MRARVDLYTGDDEQKGEASRRPSGLPAGSGPPGEVQVQRVLEMGSREGTGMAKVCRRRAEIRSSGLVSSAAPIFLEDVKGLRNSAK